MYTTHQSTLNPNGPHHTPISRALHQTEGSPCCLLGVRRVKATFDVAVRVGTLRFGNSPQVDEFGLSIATHNPELRHLFGCTPSSNYNKGEPVFAR